MSPAGMGRGGSRMVSERRYRLQIGSRLASINRASACRPEL
jgi:hypothetical protein